MDQEKVRRNTKQREYVLEAVISSCSHPTAEEIYKDVVKKCDNVSLTTVYRNLNLLSDEGKIWRITIPNEPDRFDKTVRAHYHISCVLCGNFEDVDIPYNPETDKEAVLSSGYIITGHSIIFRGICPECQKIKNN